MIKLMTRFFPKCLIPVGFAAIFTGFSLALIPALFISSPAFAYYTVQDTGNLVKPNQEAIGTSLQWITQGPTLGVNLLGHLDVGFNDSSNFRFEAGGGATDAVLGAYYKWVPFPDYEQQPAVGFIFGAQYAHYHGASEVAARIVPLASKKFAITTDSVSGTVTPFVALPIGLSSYRSTTGVPVQIAFGAKYHDDQFKVCDFMAELDFDVNQAPNSIVIGAQFPAF